MAPRAVALIGLLSTAAGCACGPQREATDWSAHRGRAETLRALYLGLEPSLQPTPADVTIAHDGARREARCEATGGPRVSAPGELEAIVDRVHALRARCLTLVSQADDPRRPASESTVAEVERLLDQVDGTLKAGAADPASATALLNEVVDRLDLAEAMLDRLSDRTM